MNLTTSQDKVFSYLQQFGKTMLHDTELAEIEEKLKGRYRK